MQVVRCDAAALVAPECRVGRRVGLSKARRQQQEERGRAVLRLAHSKVVIPDAVRAVVGEQEEGRVRAQPRLDREQKGAQGCIECAQPRHEVLVCRHEIEETHAWSALRRVQPRELLHIAKHELGQLGAADALTSPWLQERLGVVAAWAQLGLTKDLPRIVVRHASGAKA